MNGLPGSLPMPGPGMPGVPAGMPGLAAQMAPPVAQGKHLHIVDPP